jgi:3-oxoacyl-(acyl-carrier-protein) synthase
MINPNLFCDFRRWWSFVMEEYEHVKASGVKIYAEITGYGATSDGSDMVAPS